MLGTKKSIKGFALIWVGMLCCLVGMLYSIPVMLGIIWLIFGSAIVAPCIGLLLLGLHCIVRGVDYLRCDKTSH